MTTSIKEQLADLCHRQWSGWMNYLFSKCEINPDGSRTIPLWAVQRWYRQMVTDYKDLSDSEQNSDLAEADKFLKEFKHVIDAQKELNRLKERMLELRKDCCDSSVKAEILREIWSGIDEEFRSVSKKERFYEK